MPFNFAFFVNYAAIGLTGNKQFNCRRLNWEMLRVFGKLLNWNYNYSNEMFSRKSFYYNIEPLTFNNTDYYVTLNVGVSHTPHILIDFYAFSSEIFF